MPLTESHERYANFYHQEQYDYRESQKDFWDLFAVTETAEKKGIAKGRAEGRAEGRVEGRAEGRDERNLEIARNMKNDNIPVATIAKYTGLTEEEINRL